MAWAFSALKDSHRAESQPVVTNKPSRCWSWPNAIPRKECGTAPDSARKMCCQVFGFRLVSNSGLRVSGSRNGVSGSRGVFFPEWCFQFPEGSVVPKVFSVPGLGCFQFPDSGLLFPEWCVGRPWVFSVPGMVFPVPGQRERHGGVCDCLWFPYGVSSCFSAFLCSLLPSFFFLFFPHFFRFCLASCYFCFLSSVPAFPLPFLLLRFL